MKKKLVIALDILVIAIVTLVMFAGKSVQSIITGIKSTPAMAANEELSFNLKADPEKARVKAGATVVVTLSVNDIKAGEAGLNNIVGKLGYNEALFDSVEIHAGGPDELNTEERKWEIEVNRIKGHDLYGKFCIFTMQEGVKENQNVATLIFKLKSDLKPQTTKVTFTELESSDGEVSIPEEDREVEITIYDDEVIPDEPEQKDPVNPDPVKPNPVQTADSQTLFVIIALVSTIIINILVFTKTKKNKILGSILVVLVGFLSMQYAAYAAQTNQQEILAQMAYKETWLNSENYLVTEENISRIVPNTDIEELYKKFNKAVEVKNGNQKVTSGKISTGMTINVENPSKQDAEGDFKYAVSVFGDINGDSNTDHVDLTDTIRNVVDKDKWKLEGVREISADIKLDNKIDREDVLTSVRHIVYGELQIPTFESVKEPEIKITQGTKDSEKNCYIGEVTIAITQKQEDAIKTQYKISKDGEEIADYTKVKGEITLLEDGVYKISAYTTGKLGNRSEIPYILVNIDKSKDTTLKIHHYSYKSKEAEEKVKVAEDEMLPIEYDKQYIVTNLMLNTNKITIDGKESSIERNYLESDQYTYKEVEYDTENATATQEGVVTGTAVRGMKEISYYYEVKEYTITGQTDENAQIKNLDATGLIEKVEYNQNSKKIYVKAKNGFKISKVYKYTGDRINGNYTANDGEVLSLKMDKGMSRGVDAYKYYVGPFNNVKENIHLVVTTEVSVPVVKIIGVPTGFDEEKNEDGEQILGNEYDTLEKAIYDAESLNAKRDDTNAGQPVTIQILSTENGEQRVINESNEIKEGEEGKGNDVVIDLNGQKIESSDPENPTLKVDPNCSLRIVDNSEGQEGIVENKEGVAIKQFVNAIVIIGENNDIATGLPSTTTPTIKGATYGIYKVQEGDEEGKLNFYDGQIIGKSGEDSGSLGGGTQYNDYPVTYSVSTNEKDGEEVTTLQRENNIEAVIGKQKFNTLEEAFDEINNNIGYNLNEPVEIDVVSEDSVLVENTIVVNNNKNIVLDLNGRTIKRNSPTDTSNSTYDYLFENNGIFEIKDSTANKCDDDIFYELKHSGEYYLEYDGNYLTNNNANISDSISDSYIEVDLTNAINDSIFEIVPLYNTTAWYMYSSDSAETNREVAEANRNPREFSLTLEKGKKHYVHFGTIGADRLIIQDIKIDGKRAIENLITGKGRIYSEEINAKSLIYNNENAKLVLKSIELEPVQIPGTVSTPIPSAWNCVYNLGELQSDDVRYYGKILNESENKTIELNGGYAKFGIVDQENDSNTIKLSGNIVMYGPSVPSQSLFSSGINTKGELELNSAYLISTPYYCNKLTCNNVICIDSEGKVSDEGTIENGEFDSLINLGNLEITNAKIQNFSNEGTTTIKNGNIDSVGNSGTLKIKNGNYSHLSNSGELNIENASIISNEKNTPAISMSIDPRNLDNQPILNLCGGIVESKKDAAISTMGSCIINIGKKNTETDKIVSANNPSIKGNTAGIVLAETLLEYTGQVNFYDGEIIAPEGEVLKCGLNETEQYNEYNERLAPNYEIIELDDTAYERLTLVSTGEVAKISSSYNNMLNLDSDINYKTKDNYYYFSNIQDAIDIVKDNSLVTIELNKNITAAESYNVAENKNIVIDLNGKELDISSSNFGINNSGKLKITNTDSKNGFINSTSKLIKNEESGTLELNAVKITGNIGTCQEFIINNGNMSVTNGSNLSVTKSLDAGDVFENYGTLELNSCTDTIGIYNGENGECTISGELDKTNIGSLKNENNAVANINGGKVVHISNYNTSDNSLNITNGDITTIYSKSNLDVKVVEGKDVKIKTIDALDKTLKFENVTFDNLSVTDVGTTARNRFSKIIMKNCKGNSLDLNMLNGSEFDKCNFKSVNLKSKMQTDDESISTIKDSTFEGTTFSGNTKFEITNCTINGNITNDSDVTIKGNSTVNGYIDNNSKLTLGDDSDGLISKECPVVIGSRTDKVIVNNGTLYYYDGKLASTISYKTTSTEPEQQFITGTGTVSTSSGASLTYLDPEYSVSGDITTKTSAVILTIKPLFRALKTSITNSLTEVRHAENGDYYEFYSLQDAINVCSEATTTTIEFMDNISFSDADSAITISKNKDIVFDLKDYNITSVKENAIENNGKLTINYSNKNNIILNGGNFIVNNGELNIQPINGETDCYIKANKALVMTNNGTATLKGVNLDVTASEGTSSNIVNVITNNSEATLTIDGGKVSNLATYTAVVKNYGDLIIKNNFTTPDNIANTDHIVIQNVEDCNAEIANANISSKIENSDNAKLKVTNSNSTKNFVIINTSSNENAVIFDGGNCEQIASTNGTVTINQSGENPTNIATAFVAMDGKLVLNNGNITNYNTYLYGGTQFITFPNRTKGEIVVNGGKISNGYTLQNGKATVYGGEVGINNNAYGTLTVGNDDETINSESPVVLLNEGKVNNYYDGKVKVDYKQKEAVDTGIVEYIKNNQTIVKDAKRVLYSDTATILNGVTNTASDAAITFDFDDENSKIIYSVEQKTYKPIKIGANKEFTSLLEAINSIEDNTETTITLYDNIELNDAITISNDRNIIIDLNGYNIIQNNNKAFTIYGNVTLKNSKEDTSIFYGGSIAINNNLTIGSNVCVTGNLGVNGNMSIDEGFIFGEVVINNTSSNVTISGNKELYIDSLYVKNGTATIDNSNAIFNKIINESLLNISNIRYAEYITDSCNSTIKNAIINRYEPKSTGKSSDASNERNLDKCIIGTAGAISGQYLGKTTISNTEVCSTVNVTTNLILKENVTVNAESLNESMANTLSSLFGDKKKIKRDAYQAIRMTNSALTLGEKDYIVDKESIKIYGGTYGLVLNNNATLNFYDGTIYGDQKAINENGKVLTKNYEYLYKLASNEEDTEAWIELENTIDDWVKLEGGSATSDIKIIIDNINGSANKIGTIQVLGSKTITDKITIPAGTNITIDLAGYNIIGVIDNNPLIEVENGATLTIIDSSEDQKGQIANLSSSGYSIKNNGTLNIGKTGNDSTSTAPTILSKNYAINNASSSIINMFCGKLYGINGTVDGDTNINVPAGKTISQATGAEELIDSNEKVTYYVQYINNN